MEELRGLTPIDLKPEFSGDEFSELTAPLRTGSQDMITFETRHRRKNGTEYPVKAHRSLLR